ncbi:MAG: CvpA family protein [Treponema sp.]|nr:CvpA family protein [Treponema sp.]
MSYAPIDIVFLLIVLFFTILAASRGLIKEFFSRAAFIAGIVAAVIFTPRLEPFVQSGVHNMLLAKIISFLLIFVIAFLAVKIVQHIVGKIFSGEIMKGLDRSLGVIFGIVEGLAVVALILIVIETQTWFKFDTLLENSFFSNLLNPIITMSSKKIQEFPS